MSQTSVPSALTQLPLSEEDRSRYSVAQLHDYFKRLGLPQKYLDSPLLSDRTYAATTKHGLPFLQGLMMYHTCNVPFENLELHYSAHKTITLDVANLYTKIVRKSRGGRCMENNTFFGTVLRSLGYEVRNCGGRVSRAMSPFPEVRRNQGTTYDGWNHMLNLVRLDEEWYVVDVGMGAMGPNLPYPLRDGFEITSIVPRKIRLQSRAIAESYGNHSNELWCYDVCYNPTADAESVWLPVYCFTKTEFLPQDYEIMSWYTSTHKNSFFTKYVTSTRMLMDESSEMIVGNVTLFGSNIKETVGGKRHVVKDCTTEDERIDGLREIFGIVLTEEEKEGISADLSLG
jgi:arylamine N-acetyltransferase